MFITTIKEFAIQLEVQTNILRVEWIGGQVMRHFRSALEGLEAVARQAGATRLLLDIDAMPEIPVYDQLWLSTHFMPTLTRLPIQRVVIMLSNKRVYNQQVIEGILLAARLQIRFDLQFFTQPEAALYWLTDNSPHLPALLAEWEQAYPAPPGRSNTVAEPRPRYGQE